MCLRLCENFTHLFLFHVVYLTMMALPVGVILKSNYSFQDDFGRLMIAWEIVSFNESLITYFLSIWWKLVDKNSIIEETLEKQINNFDSKEKQFDLPYKAASNFNRTLNELRIYQLGTFILALIPSSFFVFSELHLKFSSWLVWFRLPWRTFTNPFFSAFSDPTLNLSRFLLAILSPIRWQTLIALQEM